jgi:hypothetical protein
MSTFIDKGANHLFCIIIWKLQCERRISFEDNPEKYHSEVEVHNRWINTINTRLTMDQLITNRKYYGIKALKS